MFHRDETYFVSVHFVGLLHECKKTAQLSQRVWFCSQCKQRHFPELHQLKWLHNWRDILLDVINKPSHAIN